MAVTVNGNHRRGYKSNAPSGVGVENVPVGMGWLSVTGSVAAETFVGQVSSLLTGDLNQGVFFQSEAGASVSFTLCNPAMAASRNPADLAAIMWDAALALPAGDIVQAPVLFTAYKITFTAPGTVYIGAL